MYTVLHYRCTALCIRYTVLWILYTYWYVFRYTTLRIGTFIGTFISISVYRLSVDKVSHGIPIFTFFRIGIPNLGNRYTDIWFPENRYTDNIGTFFEIGIPKSISVRFFGIPILHIGIPWDIISVYRSTKTSLECLGRVLPWKPGGNSFLCPLGPLKMVFLLVP